MTLRQAGVSLFDCEHRTPAAASEGVPYIAIPQMKKGRLDPSEARLVAPDDVRTWNRRVTPTEGDIILSRRTNPGVTAVVPRGFPCVLGQNLVILRSTQGLVDQTFLRWLVQGPEWWEQIQKFLNVGAVFDSLRCADVPNFELTIPPPGEQRAIAHILSALDDKIDLNRRMAATLEEMARALFREHLLNRSDDKWGTTSLSSIAHFQNGLALQKYPLGEGAGLPAIKIAQLRAGNTDGADIVSADLPEATRVFDGDVVFSWSGTLECRIWAGGRGALNQHLFKVTSERYPRWFYYLWILEHLPAFRGIAADKATTMGHINRTHLDAAQVLVPADETLAQLDTVLAPILERAHLARLESRTLTEVRDTILPKLISGQLRVPSAKRLLESPR